MFGYTLDNFYYSTLNTGFTTIKNKMKDNLAVVFSVFGDPLMSVPLLAYTYSTFVESFFDSNSEGNIEDSSIIYLGISCALMLFLYPGQILIAHNKNKKLVQKFLYDDLNDESIRESKEDSFSANLLKTTAVVTTSVSAGISGYLLVSKFSEKCYILSIPYGAVAIALNVMFRQIFFNSKDEYAGGPHTFSFSKRLVCDVSCSSFSLLYALMSATPFAAAFIYESDSNMELATLTTMLVIMTFGQYLRMNPGLKNYFGLLESNRVELNKFENFICVCNAIIRTGLTMFSVKDYPLVPRISIFCALTPGVGLFQVSSCKPPEEFAYPENNNGDIELIPYTSESETEYADDDVDPQDLNVV